MTNSVSQSAFKVLIGFTISRKKTVDLWTMRTTLRLYVASQHHSDFKCGMGDVCWWNPKQNVVIAHLKTFFSIFRGVFFY